jgi:hypothetical protein
MENIPPIVYKHLGKSHALREGRIHLLEHDENHCGRVENETLAGDSKWTWRLLAILREPSGDTKNAFLLSTKCGEDISPFDHFAQRNRIVRDSIFGRCVHPSIMGE